VYFESKCPEDITTYTRLDNLAKDTRKDFERLVIETITEAMMELEDL
jgi:predicted DNA-binding protein